MSSGLQGSYWAASAKARAPLEPLRGDLDTDVAIVGAGYTGLSTAWHLHRRGIACVVLEAGEVGAGASGRTGGQVVPRFKFTFPELAGQYGREAALAMHGMAHEAADLVESIVTELGIDCGYRRTGHLTPIEHAADAARFEADVAWLASEAGDGQPRMLGRDETRDRVGSARYRAAYFEPRGASLQPFDYSTGFAAALAARGVPIAVRSPVTSWRHDGPGVVANVGAHRVRARQLVMATNGYTDTHPAGDALKRRIVPIVSSQIATAPLAPEVRETILKERNTATDAKRLTHYYRVMGDDRFVFGGRSGATNRESEAIFRRLGREMVALFPQLAGVPVEYAWSGRVAVTVDGLPHLGRLDQRVCYGMGYNGRGVALSALFGARLADWVTGDAVRMGPLTDSPFEPIPFHFLQVPAKAAAIAYKRVLDAVGA